MGAMLVVILLAVGWYVLLYSVFSKMDADEERRRDESRRRHPSTRRDEEEG